MLSGGPISNPFLVSSSLVVSYISSMLPGIHVHSCLAFILASPTSESVSREGLRDWRRKRGRVAMMWLEGTQISEDDVTAMVIGSKQLASGLSPVPARILLASSPTFFHQSLKPTCSFPSSDRRSLFLAPRGTPA